MIHQMHVMHPGRAGRHAGQARQAAINMPDLQLTRRTPRLQHILDQINPAPRRIQLITAQQEGWAGRGTHPAMDTAPQDAVAFRNIRVGQLGGGEKGLHGMTITYNTNHGQKHGRCPRARAAPKSFPARAGTQDMRDGVGQIGAVQRIKMELINAIGLQ